MKISDLYKNFFKVSITSSAISSATSAYIDTAISNKQDVINEKNKISYNFISDAPEIPTVNDATLTVSQNGVTKGVFSANASSNVEIDLSGGISEQSIPTNVSDLNNDVGFITEGDLPFVPTLVSDLSNDVGYITVEDLPIVNDATLTITQGSNTWTFSANASENVTINLGSGSGSSESGITLAQAKRQALIFG